MNSRIRDDGCFEGNDVRVACRGAYDGFPAFYEVIAGGTIVLYSQHLAVANGIAATLASLVPEGTYFNLEMSLATLADLVGARHLLSRLVEQQAHTFGDMSALMKSTAKRLYGSRDH